MIYDGSDKPMFLHDVEHNTEGQGAYSELVRMVRAAGGPVSQIWHLFAFRPDATQHLERFTQAIMRGPAPISPGMRELIAAYTSVLNHCPFWTNAHAAVAAELLGDEELVRAVVKDPANSPLPEPEKLLFAFLAKVNGNAANIGPQDVEILHNAGWTDEALYFAISVCALFNFYNRWIDASGVQPQSPAVHRASAKKMAQFGYVRTPPQEA